MYKSFFYTNQYQCSVSLWSNFQIQTYTIAGVGQRTIYASTYIFIKGLM